MSLFITTPEHGQLTALIQWNKHWNKPRTPVHITIVLLIKATLIPSPQLHIQIHIHSLTQLRNSATPQLRNYATTAMSFTYNSFNATIKFPDTPEARQIADMLSAQKQRHANEFCEHLLNWQWQRIESPVFLLVDHLQTRNRSQPLLSATHHCSHSGHPELG